MLNSIATFILWGCAGICVWNIYRMGSHAQKLAKASWKQGVLAAMRHYEGMEPDDNSREAGKIIDEVCGPLHLARAESREAECRLLERN